MSLFRKQNNEFQKIQENMNKMLSWKFLLFYFFNFQLKFPFLKKLIKKKKTKSGQ